MTNEKEVQALRRILALKEMEGSDFLAEDRTTYAQDLITDALHVLAQDSLGFTAFKNYVRMAFFNYESESSVAKIGDKGTIDGLIVVS